MFLRFTKSQLSPSVRQRLRIARERVTKRWTKGTDYEPTTGAYCLRGAIKRNGDVGAAVKDEAYVAVARATGLYPKVYSNPQKAIMHYNDAPGRKQEDVVSVIDKALAQ